MRNDKIRGMACTILRRTSTVEQATGLDNQLRTLNDCIAENELIVVEEVILDGITGSIPGNRTDIDRMIARKKQRNDYSLLVVPDTTRFTRAGPGHGQKLIYDLRAAGILVYFLAENLLVDDSLSEVYVSFLFSAANQQARAISRNSTMGNTNSFLDGRSTYTRRPPIGMDRMISLDGKDLYIIRNMADGTQQMLHPETEELLRTFDKNPKTGTPNHYHKQKNEQVRLVVGAPDRIAPVQMIFYLFHIEKLTIHWVAARLNELKLKSSNGVEWFATSVLAVLRNPAYIGRGIRYRHNTGIYNNGGQAEATPSGVAFTELANNTYIKGTLRARKYWKERPIPAFDNFLPENVRPLATAYIERYLDSVADGEQPTVPRDKHHQSLYILKGIMKSVQGGYSMTGRNAGKSPDPAKKTRYYAVARAYSVPKFNDPLAPRIAAVPIETAVLRELSAVILDRPNLTEALKRSVEAAQKTLGDNRDLVEMQKDYKRRSRQIALLSDDITDDEDDDNPIVQKIQNLKAQNRRLEAKIRVAGAGAGANADPTKTIEKLVDKLTSFVKNTEKAETPLLRSVLSTFVTKLEADLPTKKVSMQLAVPSWVGHLIVNNKEVGLVDMYPLRPGEEAHPENTVILGEFSCYRHSVPRCYTCNRLPNKNAA